MSLWTFQVGLNVTVDKTWVDVTSRHRDERLLRVFHTGDEAETYQMGPSGKLRRSGRTKKGFYSGRGQHVIEALASTKSSIHDRQY
jgi:hypothetical protein